MTAAQPNRSRRGEFLIPFLSVVVDASAIVGAFLFSYWLRFDSPIAQFFKADGAEKPALEAYLFGSFVVAVVWLLLFQSRSLYGTRRNVSLSDELINIVKAVSWGMLIMMSAAFFYRAFSYSRVVFGFVWITSIAFVFGGRALVYALERRFYRAGKYLQHAVIIGSDALANQVYSQLHHHASFGFNIVGYFADTPAHEELTLSSAPYLGPISGAPLFIRDKKIDLAFIALRSKEHNALFELISECEGVNVEFMMVPDVLDVLTAEVTVKELQGIPFLKIKSVPFTVWGRITKRAFDIMVSSVLLILGSPFWLLVVGAVKLTSHGPVLFKQERLGMDGKRFTMYKFRSMRVNAEAATGPVWTANNDARRTPVGVFLRKTSLDEIPQLVNVLKGDMSLVGPRPERPYFVEQFKDVVPKYLDRHRVKTGMTGWAQVNGLRGNTSLEERIKYDLYYIEHWSLAFDIKILLRTIKVALLPKEVH